MGTCIRSGQNEKALGSRQLCLGTRHDACMSQHTGMSHVSTTLTTMLAVGSMQAWSRGMNAPKASCNDRRTSPCIYTMQLHAAHFRCLHSRGLQWNSMQTHAEVHICAAQLVAPAAAANVLRVNIGYCRHLHDSEIMVQRQHCQQYAMLQLVHPEQHLILFRAT